MQCRVTKTKLSEVKGNGWEILKEEKHDQIDPRLEKLQELFKVLRSFSDKRHTVLLAGTFLNFYSHPSPTGSVL